MYLSSPDVCRIFIVKIVDRDTKSSVAAEAIIKIILRLNISVLFVNLNEA